LLHGKQSLIGQFERQVRYAAEQQRSMRRHLRLSIARSLSIASGGAT
jgi:hypothetical protein